MRPNKLLKAGLCRGLYREEFLGVLTSDTRRLDYSSHEGS